jgi:hypothetical protein
LLKRAARSFQPHELQQLMWDNPQRLFQFD